MRFVHSLFLLLFILGSCITQDICDENSQPELVARFKTIRDGTPADTIISFVSIYGIREGLSDSLLYDSASTSRIVLPPDPGHDHSSFVLTINDQTDTLRINHSTAFYLISYSCGFVAFFNLDSLRHTGSMIQDLEIINSSIDAEPEQNEEHLWIYF